MIIQKNNGKVVPQQSGREKFKMVAKTMMGLEEVLAEELRECGAENIECLSRAVAFEGDMAVVSSQLCVPHGTGHLEALCRV